MKISYQWLREWVPLRLSERDLAERLTLAGIEVAAIEPVAPDLDKVVVARILTVTPHPQADPLRLCHVDAGKPTGIREIVCGASNAEAGMHVPLALPGATLPVGKTISETEIRGIRSHGMLCSSAELGLDDSAGGLLDLGPDVHPGQPLSVALALNDSTLEIELTPNRGDCLSIAGLAREIAALTGARLRRPAMAAVKPAGRTNRLVQLKATGACPRYVGRIIENIDPRAKTQLWMRERLRRGGLRAIHPVVDVTNYVMLELGQPMHAFDLARLDGAIQVRLAKSGEQLRLLDGQTIKLSSQMLVIADQKRPLALAGIMGGMDSAVGAQTTSILLESAFFSPEAVAGRARALGLHTDSSHRFERGVDPALQRLAIERATRLILDIAGGRPGPVFEKLHKPGMPKTKPVDLRAARITRLLGMSLPAMQVSKILSALNMTVKRTAAGWRVIPPSFRFDITREVDLVEELARVHGYANLPARSPLAMIRSMPAPEGLPSESRLRRLMTDRDFQEVITYSFVDPELNRMIQPSAKPIVLSNPISADMSVMRSSLWPGLLQSLQHNLNRQQLRLRLFEIGRCFERGQGSLRQDKRIGALVYGAALPEQWGVSPGAADFYDLKSDAEALLGLAGLRDRVRFEPFAEHPALHPGQAAKLMLGQNQIGQMGVLHPALKTSLKLDGDVLLFEALLEPFLTPFAPKFSELSKYPSIRRDIAVVVGLDIALQKVLDIIKVEAGYLLIDLQLFDEYRGKGIDSGRKSLALGLTLQDSSRTLKDSDVEGVIQRVVSALESRLGAKLRQ
ncbi:MAG: phenylalanine--tRNA ligase subunit beta [Candidatus Muproteobacteria bacterium RBG_16_62_13]|uniref:Phenylalanine--tRNA ligase beta subunit n=1 Tax=Candidatus Muproteobacteria bacterium RBG_16_62_13 TaxID=1817756 RepID=A0A1F6T4Q1_9PROT|nr:MAG: phenylalanine--tRNA ligase subunit beta [Candidatus Muproteobacteria bacterium RBG_16_62_13]